jgi:hypothetical protein
MAIPTYENIRFRTSRMAAWLGLVGALAALLFRGPIGAVGFAAGAALSYMNLRWWAGVAGSLGSELPALGAIPADHQEAALPDPQASADSPDQDPDHAGTENASETPPARLPGRASTHWLVLRYLLAGGAMYVIVKVLGAPLALILAGLFVAVAAVILEILYELAFSPK